MFDWLAQNWLPVVAGVLVALLVLRMLIGRLPFRRGRARVGGRTIRVIGVGGGGGNAVNHMIRSRVGGVDFVACNTDSQALDRSYAPTRIRIGDGLTRGLGAGGDAAIGERAAEEDAQRISAALDGSDMVLLTAGLGGGTGSGAGPVIARLAREAGALTVGVVTRPFGFEGSQRRAVADAAVAALTERVDALITIENDRVRELVADDASLLDAFRSVDDVVRRGIEGLLDIMTTPGIVNLDFADVRTVLADAGPALLGIGRANGPDRAVEAARAAVRSPLLAQEFAGARRILFAVTASSALRLDEVTAAADEIRRAADPDANVIFGTTIDDRAGDELTITVIATGFDGVRARAATAPTKTPATSPTRATATETTAPRRSRPRASAAAKSAPAAPATAAPAAAAPAPAAPAAAAPAAPTRPAANRLTVRPRSAATRPVAPPPAMPSLDVATGGAESS